MFDKPYVTDLTDYKGPVDGISPYHYYQFIYWRLRGKWRGLLYDWTRREPCDVTAAVTPKQILAGARATLTFTLKFGKDGLPEGGRVAVYFPMTYGGWEARYATPTFQGPDGQRGYGARITARTNEPGADLLVLVHSCGSVFTVVEVRCSSGGIPPGGTLDIVVGDPVCKPPMACDHAKHLPFRTAVDFGDDGTFRPVRPSPTIEVVGNAPKYLRCFAPATVAEGKPFALRVIAADLQSHNQSYHYKGALELGCKSGDMQGTTRAAADASDHGSLRVEGVRITGPGPHRIEVIDRENGLMGLTNPISTDIAPPGMQVFFGEIHSHTDLSDGVGTPEDSYRWARDVEGLDFSALADHFEDGQSYNATLEDKWRTTKGVTEAFNDPGRFVTLLGYEIGTLEAHRNVYFADGVGRMIVEGRGGETVTMNNVYDKLKGTEYILIPHAPKFHGINWDAAHNPDTQRLVEICSWWGISEEGGPLSVRTALDIGYEMGFTGGTDNHVAQPGNPDLGGITGVYAKELTRQAIFEALKARRTFATSGPRMTIRFEAAGAFMGETCRVAEDVRVAVAARALTCEPIRCLEIIRNGEVVHTIEGSGGWDARLAWTDPEPAGVTSIRRRLGGQRSTYYYLRVTTVNGGLGWSSPVWVHVE